MRRIIAAINMTIDGVCDHTAVDPDDEIHVHYDHLLRSGDAVIYGRTTYQLMEYWPTVVANPTGNKSTDDFATTIDNITKIVFSRTLKDVTWRNSRIAGGSLEEEVAQLRQQPGKDVFVGSPGLIIQALNSGLVDELQLCIHPIVAGRGMKLFENISDRVSFKLERTKAFARSAVIHYYTPEKRG